MCSRDRGPGEHVGCPVGFTWVTLTGDDATAVLRWLRSEAEARGGVSVVVLIIIEFPFFQLVICAIRSISLFFGEMDPPTANPNPNVRSLTPYEVAFFGGPPGPCPTHRAQGHQPRPCQAPPSPGRDSSPPRQP